VGKGLVWPLQETVSCQQNAALGWRACLRVFSDASVLLIGGSDGGGMLLWQSGESNKTASAFRPRLERFLPVKGGEPMPDALRRQRGFSLPETLLAMACLWQP
jgi:hypothetical protein